jgi:hypothetical protein
VKLEAPHKLAEVERKRADEQIKDSVTKRRVCSTLSNDEVCVESKTLDWNPLWAPRRFVRLRFATVAHTDGT